MLQIPTYNNDTDQWSESYYEPLDWIDFLVSIFKEPGKYDFDETSFKFNKEARRFDADPKNRTYCTAPFRSKDFLAYWEGEKDRIKRGVLYLSKGKSWYLAGDYYMWLNFLPIYNKDLKDFMFPDVRDAQYHIQLYEELAYLHHEHAAILKKRQIASSYYHCGKLIRKFWFFDGAVCKIAASLKDYINEKGSWRFLEEYRNFLNKHTAWYRPCTPDKVLNWEQKIESNYNGRKTDEGNKSVILGYGLDKSPTNGVGGPCDIFFHEEAGIAPNMNTTCEYLLPALKSGMNVTGFFIAAGSVGDLEQCEPLREMILNPKAKDIYAVETNLMDANGTIGMCGLFIPEQWSMPPFIDKYGNSLVAEAIKAILDKRIADKKILKPEDYQLRISQNPINIEEAFAYRKESKFPQHLVTANIKRIEDKEYFVEYVDLERDSTNTINITKSKHLPISEFPLTPKTVNKEGAIVMHKRPIENPPFGMYIGSVDPVGEGKTTTSASLCSIYIYKTEIEKTLVKADGSKEVFVEPGELVCWWCGRFDDINNTHIRLELMIEIYNAWTVIENNIGLFILYMIARRKHKYLVPKSQMLFLKDIEANKNVYQEYGWKNVGTLFKSHMLSYGIEFLSEVIATETKTDGEIVRITYGIERLPDIMLMLEMKAYRDGLNVDRIVAYVALVSFVTIQMANRGAVRVTEHEKSLVKPIKNDKLVVSPFRNMGRNGHSSSSKPRRSPFKNYK